MVARITLLLALMACSAPPSLQTDERARVPAQVIAPSSAAWLERATREEEERPEIVLAAMKLKNGDVVADVGAGTGFYTRRLARAVAPNGMVYANDIQPEMLAILREKAAAEKLTNIIPILGAERDPKLPERAFDWILLVDVYHEFQEPAPMLAAIRRALKPGGRVALVEYRETTTHIRREHRMSKDEVLREWLPAGFRLVEIIEEMPMQRMYVFEAGRRRTS
ncbi:MAG TPA: class I SAM-dependent methyltransferase [Thermoanaerobaculia bacterium]|nr:class I SAM-dependent methyltransferase [Thermoanaerobaculia bacterium]